MCVVFASEPVEMERQLAARGTPRLDERYCDGVVRLRGLPFGCRATNIVNFFEGTTHPPNQNQFVTPMRPTKPSLPAYPRSP